MQNPLKPPGYFIKSMSVLGLSYGDFDVFSGVTASVPRGAKIGLVGPNGIGKTSLLAVLAGTAPATSGSVTLAQAKNISFSMVAGTCEIVLT